MVWVSKLDNNHSRHCYYDDQFCEEKKLASDNSFYHIVDLFCFASFYDFDMVDVYREILYPIHSFTYANNWLFG